MISGTPRSSVMPQRRYTKEQIQNTIAMGERPPNEANWYTTAFSDYIPDFIEPALREEERAVRGIKAGVVGSVPQLGYIPQFVSQGIAAGADYAQGKPFWE